MTEQIKDMNFSQKNLIYTIIPSIQDSIVYKIVLVSKFQCCMKYMTYLSSNRKQYIVISHLDSKNNFKDKFF